MLVNSLFWLHIPKCGTSFGISLLLLFCPQFLEYIGDPPANVNDTAPFFYNISAVTPWRDTCRLQVFSDRQYCYRRRAPDGTLADLECFTMFPQHDSYPGHRSGLAPVGLFRPPVHRLLSHLYFNLALGNSSNVTFNRAIWVTNYLVTRDNRISPAAAAIFKEVYRAIQANDTEAIVRMYASHAGSTKGMQTKMVLGIHHEAPHTLIPSDWKDRVQHILKNEFVFVGLTAEFDASTRLLFRIFGFDLENTLTDPRAKAWASVHFNSMSGSWEERRRLEKVLVGAGYHDEYDEYTYGIAKAIFYARCKFFNVSTKSTI